MEVYKYHSNITQKRHGASRSYRSVLDVAPVRQQALPSSRATRPLSRPWRRQGEGGFWPLVSSLCCRGYYQNGPQECALGPLVKGARWFLGGNKVFVFHSS